MQDQKFENLLNLALDASAEELEKSQELTEGYDEEEQLWEVIIKYSGSLETVAALDAAIQIYPLQPPFAILKVPKATLPALGALESIEYVELPKRVYFSILNAKSQSCIDGVQRGTGGINLSGNGVLVGIVDSGMDIFHGDFRNSDGSSRVLYFWDQDQDIVYDQAQINEILREYEGPGEADNFMLDAGEQRRLAGELRRVRLSFDGSGHGTAVAGICAGNGREGNGRYRGVAYEADLIVVKMANPGMNGFPRTTEVMKGVDFCIQKMQETGNSLVINLSFGNNYGSHAGNSLLEQYLDSVSKMGRNCIVVGSGNEGASNIHASVQLGTGQNDTVEFSVGNYQSSFGLQLWKMYADVVDISLRTPTGKIIPVGQDGLGTYKTQDSGTQILIYYGEPGPFSIYQEVYFDFIPQQSYVQPGIWAVELQAKKAVSGIIDFWLPARSSLSSGTGFLFPDESITLTIPSAASSVLTVGAYDGLNQTAASFSGRGYTWVENQVKPDIVAPGVDITTASEGGGYRPVTGTSFATPLVAGSAALLMEWGIVKGNDPYLYGEKIKAYFMRGARPLPGIKSYPDPQVGWGALCVRDSLPG